MSKAEAVIPVIDEELRIGARSVETGRVRVETKTEFVEEIARAELETNAVDVERVPVGREVDAVPETRTAGDVLIVPVMEEVLVVAKRLVLKEELHIKRRSTIHSVEVPVSLRKQRAEISRTGPENANNEDQTDE